MTFLIFISCWMLMIFIGIPIAVAMFVASIGYFLYTGIGINFAAQRVIDGLNSFPIIAVPLFILAAQVVQDGQVKATAVGKFMRSGTSTYPRNSRQKEPASRKDDNTDAA